MAEDILIKSLLSQFQEMFPPETSLPPQCISINGFGVEPQEDGSIRIFDSEGNLILNLLRDEEGNIVAYEDHINGCTVPITESYYCDPEDESCLYFDETSCLNTSAQLFNDESPKITVREPEPLPEPKLMEVKKEPFSIDDPDTSSISSSGSAGSDIIEDHAGPIFLVGAGINSEITIGSTPYSLSGATSSMVFTASAMVVDESAAAGEAAASKSVSPIIEEEPSVSADHGSLVYLAANPEPADDDSWHISDGPSGEDHGHGSLSSSPSSMPADEVGQSSVSEEEVVAAIEREMVPQELQGAVNVSSKRDEENEDQSTLGRVRETDRSANEMAGAAETVNVEHNFVGAPIVASRLDNGAVQIHVNGKDDSSQRNIEKVNDNNNAHDHQGEPDENRGGQHEQEGEENEEEVLH